MQEELLALGKVIQNDLQNLVKQQITGWLTDDLLTDGNWLELAVLEAELAVFWKINAQFTALDRWLTSGFMPGELPDFGLTAEEWSVETESESLARFRTPSDVRSSSMNVTGDQEGDSGLTYIPSPVNQPRNLTQTESRIPLEPEDSGYPKLIGENHHSQSLTKGGKRSPLELKQLANVVEFESSILANQDLEQLTQTESQISVKQEYSTSPGWTREKQESQSLAQTEWRSPLELKQLANVVESESFLANQNLDDQTESQIPVKQEYSTSPGWVRETQESQTQTEWRSPLELEHLAILGKSEALVLANQDLEQQTQTESQIPVKQEYSTSPGWVKETQESQTQTEWRSPLELEQLANVIESESLVLANQDLENLNQLALYSFFKEKHHQAGETKIDIEIEPNAARSINNNQEIDIDLIMEAITQEINREYRRFYGG